MDCSNQGSLGQYYTPADISSLLIDSLTGPPPSTVLDLAAGHGALWRAARSVWHDVHVTTVDIDKTLRPTRLKNHVHLVADALDANLFDQCKLGSFEAALCNPPFLRPLWRRDFAQILEDTGLARAVGTGERVPSEALFVAQNIRYACEGGSIGLILPDGLLTGSRNRPFREALLAEHAVDRIIQLPRRVFKDTDAQTHILVLRKGVSSPARIPLQLLENGHLNRPILVTHEQAAHRMDYTFHATQRVPNAVTLATLGASVVRGSVEPTAGQASRMSEFHTSSFPSGMARRSVHLTPHADQALPKTWARAGDILIARVDRKLQEKICYVVTGAMPLTTSVLRVRVSPAYRKLVLNALLSKSGSERLAAISRGVGARMIGQRELMQMELDLG